MIERLSEEELEDLLDTLKRIKRLFYRLLIGDWLLTVIIFFLSSNFGKFKDYPDFVLFVFLFNAIFFVPILCYYLILKTHKYNEKKFDLQNGYKEVERVFISSQKQEKGEILIKLTNDIETNGFFFEIHDLKLDKITSQTPLEIEYLPKSKHILSIRKL